MNEARIYCSESAVGDVMAGSADPVDTWLLLEYRPAWSAKALADNALTPPVRAWIDRQIADAAAQGNKVRPQFIRQPERDAPGVTLIVADSLGARRLEVATYDELLGGDLADAAPVGDAPLYFVCTNGRRDLCCARFGLPTYAALRSVVGARAWQTTHVGGHRFAPNVMTLPHGALYGRVHADDVPAFVDVVERGEIAFDWLRGISFEDGAVQAARVFARVAPSEQAHVNAAGADRWRVRFNGGATIECELGTPRMALASCDDAPKAVRSWRLIRA